MQCWPTARSRISARSIRISPTFLIRHRSSRSRADLLALGAREADAVTERFPQVQRRVGGYISTR